MLLEGNAKEESCEATERSEAERKERDIQKSEERARVQIGERTPKIREQEGG